MGQLCAELLNNLFISLADVSWLGSIELGVIAIIVVLALAVSLARSVLSSVNLDYLVSRSDYFGLILFGVSPRLVTTHGQ